MAFLLIVFATIFSFALTCPPTAPPTAAPTTASASTPSSPPPKSENKKKNKREVDHIEVTLVSNQKYDPAMNDSHMQVFKTLLQDYMKGKGAHYDKDMMQEKIMNVDGNFAILYTLLGYDCDTVSNFLHDAKSSANFIMNIKVKCGGRPEISIA